MGLLFFFLDYFGRVVVVYYDDDVFGDLPKKTVTLVLTSRWSHSDGRKQSHVTSCLSRKKKNEEGFRNIYTNLLDLLFPMTLADWVNVKDSG